jgi:hypothetical protein
MIEMKRLFQYEKIIVANEQWNGTQTIHIKPKILNIIFSSMNVK